MQLLSNLTALVATATSFNLLTFSKTTAVDLSGGACTDYNAVQIWNYVQNSNQVVCSVPSDRIHKH